MIETCSIVWRGWHLPLRIRDDGRRRKSWKCKWWRRRVYSGSASRHPREHVELISHLKGAAPTCRGFISPSSLCSADWVPPILILLLLQPILEGWKKLYSAGSSRSHHLADTWMEDIFGWFKQVYNRWRISILLSFHFILLVTASIYLKMAVFVSPALLLTRGYTEHSPRDKIIWELCSSCRWRILLL